MQKYLPASVNYPQNHWYFKLFLAEFPAKDQDSETYAATSFLANYWYDPRCEFEYFQPAQGPPIPEEVDDRATPESLNEIHHHLPPETMGAKDRL